MWERDEALTLETMVKMQSFCRGLSFYNALNIGFLLA